VAENVIFVAENRLPTNLDMIDIRGEEHILLMEFRNLEKKHRKDKGCIKPYPP